MTNIAGPFGDRGSGVQGSGIQVVSIEARDGGEHGNCHILGVRGNFHKWPDTALDSKILYSFIMGSPKKAPLILGRPQMPAAVFLSGRVNNTPNPLYIPRYA